MRVGQAFHNPNQLLNCFPCLFKHKFDRICILHIVLYLINRLRVTMSSLLPTISELINIILLTVTLF